MPSSPDAAIPPSVLDVIRRRQMVRAFETDEIAVDVIEAIVRAGLAGPSAGNTRSLELLVLTEARVSDYWSVTLPPTRRSAFPWPGLLSAPVLLVPYVNPDDYVSRYAEADKAATGLGRAVEEWTVPYWWVDGGAAVENVLLAAESLGLGASFFGQFEHEELVRQYFGVPAGRRAVGTIALGYPDREQDRPSASARRPRRPATDITHWERW